MPPPRHALWPARLGRRLAVAALALLAGLGPTSLRAQDRCPPPTPTLDADTARQLASQAPDRGLLWRFEKDGRHGWLYGTIHVGRPEWVFPGPLVSQALSEAQTLALEIDPLDPAMQRRLQALVAARPGAYRLPAALAGRLAAHRRAACLDHSLDTLRPEMAALTLLTLSARQVGLDPAYGVDSALALRAQALGRARVSLETPDEQLQPLLGHSPAATQAQVAELLAALDGPESLAVMQRLAQAWADSRLDELSRYAQWCQCLETPAQRAQQARLIDRRNLALADRVAARHAAGERLFVAVGALHLTGAQGLPALLAQRGYRLTQVWPVP